MDNQEIIAKFASISSKLADIGTSIGEISSGSDLDTQRGLVQMHRVVNDGQLVASQEIRRLSGIKD
jgi:hypothetical protein